MPGDVIAKGAVELEANAGRVFSEFQGVRDAAAKTAAAFVDMGGVAGKTGEVLATGLKRGVRDLTELGEAFGAVGGKTTRLLSGVTDLALTGFNPLSLAVAGVGFVLGEFVSRQRDAARQTDELQVSITRGKERLVELRDVYVDLVNKTEEAPMKRLERAVDAAELAARQATSPEAKRLAEERVSQAQEELDLAIKSNKAKTDAATRQALLNAVSRQSREDSRQNDENIRTSVQNYREYEAAVSAAAAAQEKLRRETESYLEEMHARLRAEGRDLTPEELEEDRAAEIAADNDRLKQLFRDRAELRKADLKDADAWIDQYRADEKRQADLRRDLDELGAKAGDELDRANAGRMLRSQGQVSAFTAELEHMRKQMSLTDEVGIGLAHTLTEGVASGAASALEAIETGASSAKEAFGNFAKAVLLDMQRMVVEAVIVRAVMSALGFGPVPVGGAAGAGGAAGGSAVPKSDLVRSAPLGQALEKMATVREPGGVGGAGNVSVTVINAAPSARVDVARSSGPAGQKNLKVLVSQAIADDVAGDGPAARAMRQTFGLQRSPRRRS